jgi:HAD superfamily phosphoserine phosphatase-like hydrolase
VIDRLREHRERGDAIVFVSGSWLPSVLPIAREVGADHIFCCEVGVEADTLTGEASVIPIAETKARIVRTFARERGLDLARCSAYGDDESDAPMLEAVGHPVAVRPTPLLAATARARGWETIGERPVIRA